MFTSSELTAVASTRALSFELQSQGPRIFSGPLFFSEGSALWLVHLFSSLKIIYNHFLRLKNLSITTETSTIKPQKTK